MSDTQTIEPASSSSPAEFTSGPPWMRSSISNRVDHSAPITRTDTSPIESIRNSRERRVIAPGSAATIATSNSASMDGSTHSGPSRM